MIYSLINYCRCKGTTVKYSYKCDEHCQSVYILLVMEAKKVLLFLLFQGVTNTIVFTAEAENLRFRSAYFATQENTRLNGYVVKRFDSLSFMSCSHSCLKNTWCSSTNFKVSSENDGKGTCELNKHDNSLINENTRFHEQEGATLSLLLKVMHSYILPFRKEAFFSCFAESLNLIRLL